MCIFINVLWNIPFAFTKVSLYIFKFQYVNEEAFTKVSLYIFKFQYVNEEIDINCQ